MGRAKRLAVNYRALIIQSHASPVSGPAAWLTFGLASAGVILSISTGLTFAVLPNVVPLIVGVLALDFASQFMARTRLVEATQTILYGILYLAITCLCAVVAAYASQRFALPLQDQLFTKIDAVIGFDWLSVAHWIDSRPVVQKIFHMAYDTMGAQIALPVLVLALADRTSEVRTYLLAFAITLSVTITISALLPAAGPIAIVDRAAFHSMAFTGATPVHHLMQLRQPGSLLLSGAPGGIATFPSFHAAIAVLTPLTLLRYRWLFTAVLILDLGMLGGTVTEGAHYLCDVLAGGGLAVLAYVLARQIERRRRLIGSLGWDRTSDHSINSRMLYR